MARQLTERTITQMELARRSNGLSQKDLARDPGVKIHHTFISLLERGQGIPTPDQAARLARRLGLDPDDLLKPVFADAVPEVAEPDEELV